MRRETCSKGVPRKREGNSDLFGLRQCGSRIGGSPEELPSGWESQFEGLILTNTPPMGVPLIM